MRERFRGKWFSTSHGEVAHVYTCTLFLALVDYPHIVPDSSRIARLLRLLEVLQSEDASNVDDLARECGVSRRTVFRDLNALRGAGVPIQFDEPTGSYTLASAAVLPTTNLTISEALALLVVCRRLGRRETGLPFQHPAYRAALKVVSGMPEAVREYVEDVENAIAIELDPLNPLPDSIETYERLVEAIRLGRRVQVVYGSLTRSEGEIETSIAPYRLVFRRRSWYVVGHSDRHDEVRTFNIGRIKEIEPTADAYEVPSDFSLKRHFGNAWGMIRRPEETYAVHVRFQPLVAHNVAEVRWHHTQQVHWNDDGSLDFRATVEGIDEIRWWILGYGEQAEVLAPTVLRDEIRRQAEAMLERYAEDG